MEWTPREAARLYVRRARGEAGEGDAEFMLCCELVVPYLVGWHQRGFYHVCAMTGTPIRLMRRAVEDVLTAEMADRYLRSEARTP